MIFPVHLSKLRNGGVQVSFADIPGAITCGRDETHAMEMARDCLLTVLAACIQDGDDIPRPSTLGRGQKAVEIPWRVAMKLAVFQGMKDLGVAPGELARRLGCSPRQVRRLLNLDHPSRLDRIEEALHALGLRLAVAVEKVA
ncbi:MAG: type II toxin-antitoxin system HicB family antitoxin [Candidatus Riflebacteria bacterium]|nr:type II toxin-antitoxin system HicB family antitoxin [Candidatus Riflebacteria bacterium]